MAYKTLNEAILVINEQTRENAKLKNDIAKQKKKIQKLSTVIGMRECGYSEADITKALKRSAK